jgi:phenylacetate-CoA ligase
MNTTPLQAHYRLVRESALYSTFYESYPDFNDAPVLNKPQLIQLLHKHFNLHAETTGVYLVRSGGSTRKPLVFPVDITENHAQRTALAAALTAGNMFSPTTIALNMFGYMDMYRTASILDDILEKCQATTLALSANVAYSDAYDTALHFNPDFIFGSPSKLFLFTQYLKKNGQQLNIKNLLYAGEFLLESYIPLFEECFGTQNIYSLYGSAESGIWAWCDYTKNPSLFRFIDGIIIEILNPDAEGYGNIVITNLFRKRFPIFRYNLGDIGRLVTVEDIELLELRTRETGSFSMYEVNYSLDDFKEVLDNVERYQIQLVTNKALHVEVKFLLVKDIPEAEKAAFTAAKLSQVRKVLGWDLEHVYIEAGPDLTLYTNEVTCKTPLIADFRK